MKKLIKVILVIVAIIVMANYVGNKEESQKIGRASCRERV